MDYTGAILTLVNKPHLISGGDGSQRSALPIGDGSFAIVYPGLIRCSRSLEILRLLSQRASEVFRVVVGGHAMWAERGEPREPISESAPYEAAEHAELVLRTDEVSVDGAAEQVVAAVEGAEIVARWDGR